MNVLTRLRNARNTWTGGYLLPHLWRTWRQPATTPATTTPAVIRHEGATLAFADVLHNLPGIEVADELLTDEEREEKIRLEVRAELDRRLNPITARFAARYAAAMVKFDLDPSTAAWVACGLPGDTESFSRADLDALLAADGLDNPVRVLVGSVA